MKKILKKLSIFMVLCLFLTACGKGKDNKKNNDVKKVGVLQFVEHKALDEARDGFKEKLKEKNINVEFDVKSAGADISTATQIAEKFIKDDVDMIFAIATPAAQVALKTVEESGKDIPVLFTAVTDAVSAKLVESNDSKNKKATGTLDIAPMEKQLKMFSKIDENIKNVGILYSTSEENSNIQIKQAKEIAKNIGLNIVEMGVSSSNEIMQAMDSLLTRVDAIYTITDNLTASSIDAIANKVNEAKKVSVGAESAHVEAGILITDGINYKNLGAQTAQMAIDIFNGKKLSDINVSVSDKTEKKLNEETLKKLGLDENKEIFKK